ncbi:hypothetical protein M409DRAFT_54058 [Zasmidium cellare ATCC 36951]|uniref:MYND-type domain-containing protein n=1 Tax=Zasmidium cellare ATCC 36951 TaxID=1080233 RepID=A0A6A6CMT0_ZASCE|nr:uncharacterized protein M409DRAFT_54058 [Zasmidium cellare ATCC 36951]KAF2167460.1 hypothetical protein M409DRAFT_54058 [Zasmidium cellare ATCC 36951]
MVRPACLLSHCWTWYGAQQTMNWLLAGKYAKQFRGQDKACPFRHAPTSSSACHPHRPPVEVTAASRKRLHLAICKNHDAFITVTMPSVAPVRGVIVACRANVTGANDQPTPYVRGVELGTATHLEPVVVSAHSFNNDNWISSDVSWRMGMLLKIKKATSNNLPPGHNTYSRVVNALFANADTSSDDFGKYMAPPLFGAAVVVRENGKDLGKDIEILLQLVGKYICGLLQSYGEHFKESTRKDVDRFFEPRLFGTYWRLFSMQNAAKATDPSEKAYWTALRAPIPSPNKKEACAKCGTKGSDTNKLLKCGACKAAEYCSKECQKEDWKDHKKYCVGMQLLDTMPSILRPSS